MTGMYTVWRQSISGEFRAGERTDSWTARRTDRENGERADSRRPNKDLIVEEFDLEDSALEVLALW